MIAQGSHPLAAKVEGDSEPANESRQEPQNVSVRLSSSTIHPGFGSNVKTNYEQTQLISSIVICVLSDKHLIRGVCNFPIGLCISPAVQEKYNIYHVLSDSLDACEAGLAQTAQNGHFVLYEIIGPA